MLFDVKNSALRGSSPDRHVHVHGDWVVSVIHRGVTARVVKRRRDVSRHPLVLRPYLFPVAPNSRTHETGPAGTQGFQTSPPPSNKLDESPETRTSPRPPETPPRSRACRRLPSSTVIPRRLVTTTLSPWPEVPLLAPIAPVSGVPVPRRSCLVGANERGSRGSPPVSGRRFCPWEGHHRTSTEYGLDYQFKSVLNKFR